ncbi:hypothetical protein C1645_765344 [Glomus cerebriforme]|uniref:BTB domain-containing protein n=1 Tax=Glomus cerebriforme TaxID=658196 RepID=A0A397T1Z0_9GLOM|nr:hypothetical protein C1645_765344 [Glomus cerebriforme]
MLFLRSIESCSLYHMKDKDIQLKWQAKIKNIDSCRDSRRRVDNIDNAQIYQLDIERVNDMQNNLSEIWAICTGGHDRPEFKKFSEEKLIKPRGGVAILLAKSYKSLDELRAESFPNPPELTGKIYSHLSLPIISNLRVHLDGNFSLPSSTSSFAKSYKSSNKLRAESISKLPDLTNKSSLPSFGSNLDRNISLPSSTSPFLQDEYCDDAEWNRYILFDVLPDLHVKLLEYIVELEEIRYKNESSDFIPHTTNNFWPNSFITNGLYKKYGLKVIEKLGLKSQRFFWTGVNGGQFVSLREARILEKERTNIVDLLVDLGVKAVKLDNGKIRNLNDIVESGDHPNFPYEPVTGEIVCENLHDIPDIKDKLEDNHDLLFELLNFILQDKNSFDILTGLPLVPLSNKSVGNFGELYYIGRKEHLELFPSIGPSKFVSIDIPENLFNIFNDVNFPAFTNIKKIDASAVLDLLMSELRPLKERTWDPNGNSIPNEDWLKKIWSILDKITESEFARFSKYPLLPITIQPPKLIRPDMKNPLLYMPEDGHNLHNLCSILMKLEVRFINIKFPENVHENLKKCIVRCTPSNIIDSLERTCSLQHKTMEQLFKAGELSSSDYEKFRTFIKEELVDLINYGRHKKEFMKVLRSLPIWPIHSSEEKFIDAAAGKLLSNNLPFFSFDTNTNFYQRDRGSFEALTKIGASLIEDESKYLQDYIIPQINTKSPIPSKDYITFLQNILSLRNVGIEDLRQYQLIPNKSLTTFMRADSLYDTEVLLFRNIFEDDKFLPSELQNDSICLKVLRKMGLNHQVDNDTYIKCALEIESQFQQPYKFPMYIVKLQAKYLIDYLYTYPPFSFTNEQWDQIMHIKFIPSENCLQSPFQEEAKETLGFESFAVLCLQRYKEVCWTEKPLFERSVEPDNSFCECYPTIGKPSPEEIIKHWLFVVKEIKSRFTWKSTEIKRIMIKIYKIMNEFSQVEILKDKIKFEINDSNKKIFLNGDDPFDENSWVAGKELVFGIQEDIKEGMYKVNTYLIPFKSLLFLAGAYEIEELEELEKLGKFNNFEKDVKIDQKEMLVNNLLNRFIAQSDKEYHDVFFTFDREETRIGANRYVLSAASTYFKIMFSSGLNESAENKIEILIKDIHSDTFWILLRWLYGQTFEDAIKSILCKPDDFKTDQYLSFLVNLLRVTDIYDVESLKDKVVNIIVKGRYIGACNLYKIIKCSEDYNAQQLGDYYERYIKSNRELVKEQLLKLHTNAANDRERSEEISEISNLLDPFLSD